MARLKALLIAAPIAVGLLAAPIAHADWHGRGGWHGDRHGGPGVAPLLFGLGAAAVVGGAIAAESYPQPYYYAPPTYYAPAPGYYYGPPAYYVPNSPG